MTLARTTRTLATIGMCAAVLVGALGACSGDDDAAATTTTVTTVAPTTSTSSSTSTTTTTTSTTSSTTTTTTLPAIPRQPLTGAVLAPGEAPIPRPALAVKIDNAPPARRNHTGLAVADIVFEEIVEGSITRFAAVFHSTDADPVGPIRSGRSQDVDILTSFGHPLFAWSGGNPGVTRLIAESALTDLNWQKHSGAYYRGPGSLPHNLYSSTERLYALAPPDLGAPPQQYVYLRPEETFSGAQTTGADIDMRGIDVAWDWDPAAGRFMRSQEGGPHLDKTYGPIGATNVVVMIVEYQPSQIDARSPEAQTIGNGPVYVLSNGLVATGRWARDSADQPIQFVGDGGQPIALTPGNTWIELAEALPSDDPANPFAWVTIR